MSDPWDLGQSEVEGYFEWMIIKNDKTNNLAIYNWLCKKKDLHKSAIFWDYNLHY